MDASVANLNTEIWELKKQLIEYEKQIDFLKYVNDHQIKHEKNKTYTKEQRDKITKVIDHYSKQGIPKVKIFETLNLNSTTYYSWFKKKEDARNKSCLRITPAERKAIIDMKNLHPEWGCYRISGQLRLQGIWVSSTTVYNYLKIEGLIVPLTNRPNPAKEPKYLPFKPNQIWALDWSYIRINGTRWNLLAIIDAFSKYLVGFAILKTIKGQDVRKLISLAYLDQNIGDVELILSMDLGTPNKAHATQKLIKELGLRSKYSEVARPTQNAYIERFFGSIKRELIYAFGPDGFRDYDNAVRIIDDYIDDYNNNRSHQGIFNFIPYDAHYLHKNKSVMSNIWKQKIVKSRNDRINHYK